ncbi:zinc-ribbon domain-containing protein [Urechidicola croceus]|uniref:Zinc-ribbon 15 domain-containing protein n=1 Tax=Urechidicola croceus TaxID=1850246 RepID=A0A1D8P6M7_9FLAO|nr:zinc-ribbon domain-containing protein [Urechidicola croceus]AOW20231.1 hypothetical protein LPB138_05865 [Urechidicola croceus]
MIFYGTKGSLIHTEQTQSVKCNSCNQQSQHTVSIFGKYAYIYWIPIFPIGKKGVSECNHCKATFEKKDMSEQLKLACQNINTNVRTPLKYWSGMAIIAALIGFAMYSSNQHKEDVAQFIESPLAGDIVEYKTNDFFTTFKIMSVTSDSIFVIDNDYEIESKSAIYKIDKDENYTTEPYSISRTRYKELFTDKTLLDIDRD